MGDKKRSLYPHLEVKMLVLCYQTFFMSNNNAECINCMSACIHCLREMISGNRVPDINFEVWVGGRQIRKI